MKKTIVGFFLRIGVFILALCFVHPVHAHGDEPRLEINADHMNPGGVIEVRGVDFETDELVLLELIGTDVTLPLGEVVADVEGVFIQIVTLPVDLKEGTYSFRATTDDHEILSPSFAVWGTAILDSGENGQREEEDGLFAPMPTLNPVVAPTIINQVNVDAPVDTASPWKPVVIVLSVLVVLVLAVVIGRKRVVR